MNGNRAGTNCKMTAPPGQPAGADWRSYQVDYSALKRVVNNYLGAFSGEIAYTRGGLLLIAAVAGRQFLSVHPEQR